MLVPELYSFPKKYRLEVQKQQRLDELAQAVVCPLKKGLLSFTAVMEMLLHMPADPYGIITQDDSKIRREIKNMDFYMNSSQKVAVHALEGIDRETEELTAELGVLTNQKKKSESELRNLKQSLQSHESSLTNYKNSLEIEERNLKSARDTLNKMNERGARGAAVTGVGVGLMVIPIAGWIVGRITWLSM